MKRYVHAGKSGLPVGTILKKRTVGPLPNGTKTYTVKKIQAPKPNLKKRNRKNIA